MKNRYVYVAAICLWAGMAFGQEGQTPAGTANPDSVVPVVVAAQTMSGQDAELLSAKHEALLRAARFYDYDLGIGDWTVNQAVCPEATGSLIVQLSEGGPASQSFFSAVIPRNGGSIRIIPVLHQGIPSRWKFGEDPQQREFLERVIPTGETARSNASADWVRLAGCYAALEGVRIGSEGDLKSILVQKEPAGWVSQIAFAGIEPNGDPITWRIQYDSRGRIAAMEATNGEDLRAIPNTAAPPKAEPVAHSAAATDFRSIPNAAAQPKPVPVSSPPAGTDLRSIPNTVLPELKLVPTSNLPLRTDLRAIPNAAMSQPRPKPGPNQAAATGHRPISGTATAPHKSVPASDSPAEADLRSIPNSAPPQSKPVPLSGRRVGTQLRAIPNAATPQPKLVPTSIPLVETQIR